MRLLDRTTRPGELIEGAVRDLAVAEQILTEGGDPLEAAARAARAGQRADEAAFALLEECAAFQRQIGRKYPSGVLHDESTRKETR